MKYIIAFIIMTTGWSIIFKYSHEPFLSSMGGLLLMIGAVINWG